MYQLGFELLSEMTAPSAFYNAGHTGGFSKCHPNTRVAILERLENWLESHVEPNASIMWLYGAAGSGKSCIARSVAEWCQDQNLLLASFLFSRSDSSRNSINRFIPTLAYNITQTVPGSRPYMEDALNADPHIFAKTLEVQMLHLVVQPLVRLASHTSATPGFAPPYVFIIDGLDECLDQVEQEAIIRLFTSILRRNTGWKVLITSRPEIRSSFDAFVPASLSSRIALSNGRESDEDIRRFLEDKLADIKRKHFRRCYIPTGWPLLSDIDRLVRKSSGQFGSAASIIRYVSFENGDPVGRLHSILDDGRPMPWRMPWRMPGAQPSADLYSGMSSILSSSLFSVF